MDSWRTGARDALAEEASISAEELELDDEDASTLLEQARIAAHESRAQYRAAARALSAGRRGAVQRARRRLAGASMAAEAVLLNL